MTRPPHRPELLAPAGDFDCARAAVENGADSVYFGLHGGFNARVRATNFDAEQLPELMRYLHRRGVKGYLTLNTLAFPSELATVEARIRQAAAAGVDAVLVQDLGVARLVRAVCSGLAIHASTQMTLTSSGGLRVAEQLGIERVVLPRELSLDEIRRLRPQTELRLEVFVHGALCVAYSGQCLTSESLGGRSANRGHCAQACRLPYELICDGQEVPLGPVKYLLSPQDLAAYALIPDLIDAGVDALKIEGRLKTPEYVANVTSHYRAAIDTASAGQPVRLARRQVQEMEMSFSRGFSPGWLQGCDHKMLVPGTSSAKRGVLLGTVRGVRAGRVAVALEYHVARGDGIVFEGDRAQDAEQGGRVFQVYRRGQPQDHPVDAGVVELTFDQQAVDLRRLWTGQQVWKTDDPQLNQRLRSTFHGARTQRRVWLDLEVVARAGQPLRIAGRAANGASCDLASDQPLAAAVRHPLTADLLRAQLGRLGATVYALRDLRADIAGSPMVPLSVLGQLRRQLIADLDASLDGTVYAVAAQPVLPQLCRGLDDTAPAAPTPPTLHVLCRELEQLRRVLDLGVQDVYADFQDIRQYRPAVQAARAAGARIFLATPRIEKPGEEGILRVLPRHAPDGILARHLAALAFCREQALPVIADFSLNAANELAAEFLVGQGAQRVTASYDLNREQLLDLVAAVPRSWLEVVIHQQMPLFHMEHCVFCALLSPGTNKTNCGRPCDRHEVRLRDRIGMEHPLIADVGCRNTLLNAVPQSAAEAVPALLAHGIRHFRLELVRDDPDELGPMIELYRGLLAGRVSGSEVWRRLRASNRVGVTRGTLEERRNPLAIL